MQAPAVTGEAVGWLYRDDDYPVTYSRDHPVESGADPYAEDIRPATAENLLAALKDAWANASEAALPSPAVGGEAVKRLEARLRLHQPDSFGELHVRADDLRAILALPSPAATGEAETVDEVLITPSALQDLLCAAYEAGCTAVHDNHQADPDPSFTEASWDYVASLDFTETTRPAVSAPPPPSVDGWAISHDGPNPINDHRKWLARQLLDSKLTDEESYGIVAFSPTIKHLHAPQNPSVDADLLEALIELIGNGDHRLGGEDNPEAKDTAPLSIAINFGKLRRARSAIARAESSQERASDDQ
jgi:hypothetical protein